MVESRGSHAFARWALWLGLGCYLLALGAGALRHHDLACHLKSPTHCDACMASPPGLCAAAGAPLDATHLDDAGSVEGTQATALVPMFAIHAPGRSPPA